MKVVCLLQARMNSERLPGKIMKDISGIPIIGINARRVPAKYTEWPGPWSDQDKTGA